MLRKYLLLKSTSISSLGSFLVLLVQAVVAVGSDGGGRRRRQAGSSTDAVSTTRCSLAVETLLSSKA